MDPNQPQYSAAPQYASPAAPSAYPAATPAAPAATPATPGPKKSISLMSLVVGAAAVLSFLLSFGSFEDLGGSRFAVIDNPSFWSQAFTTFQALAMLLLAAVAGVSLFWPADKEYLGFRRSHLEVGLALYLTVTLFSYVVTGDLSAGWALVIDLLLSIIALAAAVLGHLGIVKATLSMPSGPKPVAAPYQGGYAPGVSGGGYAQPGYPQAAQPAYGTPPAAPGATYGTPAATPSYQAPSYGQPAAQPAYGQPAAQPAYGQPAAQPAYGQPAYGQPAGQPAAQPAVQPGYPQPQGYPQSPSYPQPGGYPQASPYSAAPTSAQPASAQPASGQPAGGPAPSAQPYSAQPYGGQPAGAQPADAQPYGGQPAKPAPNTSIAPPPAPDTMRIPAPPEPGAQPQASYPQQPPQSGDSLI